MMNPHPKNINQSTAMSPESASKVLFDSFLQSVDEHLKTNKKEPLCLETSKYRYNLPSEVKIYDLEQARKKYESFISGEISITSNLKWQVEETNLLVFLVLYLLEMDATKTDSFEKADWEFISTLLKRSAKECENKWASLMKSRSNKKSWTTEEDQLLTKIIKSHLKQGSQISWVNISQELFEKSERTIIKMARRCRERWINYLNPSLKKGSWTLKEDLTLLEQYLKFNKKWSTISESLKGRNLNSVKNRFHSLLKKFMIFEATDENIKALIKRLKTTETFEINTKDISITSESEELDEEDLKIEETPKKKIKIESPKKIMPPNSIPNIPPLIKPLNESYPFYNPFNAFFGFPNPQMGLPGTFEHFNGFMNGFMQQFKMESPYFMPEQLKRENSTKAKLEHENS